MSVKINFNITVFQNDEVQIVYNRESFGDQFDTKDDESLREFLADFLGTEADLLYTIRHSPFGKYIKLNHNASDSTILMSWEYTQQ